jgi:hypothetical protein
VFKKEEEEEEKEKEEARGLVRRLPAAAAGICENHFPPLEPT